MTEMAFNGAGVWDTARILIGTPYVVQHWHDNQR
ncbi:hypothetical protein DMB82_0002925 [Pectobacterium aquaticum]|nr:hypothetical protein DMB82_0002925 [Pectobacterium aquaticum]